MSTTINIHENGAPEYRKKLNPKEITDAGIKHLKFFYVVA